MISYLILLFAISFVPAHCQEDAEVDDQDQMLVANEDSFASEDAMSEDASEVVLSRQTRGVGGVGGGGGVAGGKAGAAAGAGK